MGIALTEAQAWEKLRSGDMLMRHLPWWEEKRASGEVSLGMWAHRKWDVLWLDYEGRFTCKSWLTGRKHGIDPMDINPLEGKWEEADFSRFKASNPEFLQDALDVLLEWFRESLRKEG